jgi:hypothetical protein
MLLTSTQIARLLARPRFWGSRAIRRGVFPVYCRKGRKAWVELGAVEEALGVRFSPEQLRAAGVWVPEREV